MGNLEIICKQLVKHINNGDIMIALEFFENVLEPYHTNMSSDENTELFEHVSVLKKFVEDESFNDALEVVDKIGVLLNESR